MGHLALVQDTGSDRHMIIESSDGYLDRLAVGDSVSVNGVCLTATTVRDQGFSCDLSVETLSATTAGHWRQGDRLNLETALTPAKPLGGHLVSGHVDGVGRLVALRDEGRSWRLSFEVPLPLARYVARKGSITIDGVSLTVNEVEGLTFGVNIIPQTWTHTTLGDRQVGDPVNLEVDLIARYVERLLAARELETKSGGAS